MAASTTQHRQWTRRQDDDRTGSLPAAERAGGTLQRDMRELAAEVDRLGRLVEDVRAENVQLKRRLCEVDEEVAIQQQDAKGSYLELDALREEFYVQQRTLNDVHPGMFEPDDGGADGWDGDGDDDDDED
jgi:chromosome segregation ATPase